MPEPILPSQMTLSFGEADEGQNGAAQGEAGAVGERIRDVVTSGEKVVVFTCFSDGIERHKRKLGDSAVTITGSDTPEQRMAAVDRFQKDDTVKVALCNIIAGGVGITLTAGTHVIFQDLDWVPANHAQAEDRCYRLGQVSRVTVEYFLAAGTLDGYISELLEQKMKLIAAVEAEELPDGSILAEIQDGLRKLGPALMEEARAARATGDAALRIEKLAAAAPRTTSDKPRLPRQANGSSPVHGTHPRVSRNLWTGRASRVHLSGLRLQGQLQACAGSS